MGDLLREGNVRRIYTDLKAQILGGQFKAGSRLIETSLARQYGASRLHVKSALRLLAVENLACHEEMRGFFVLPVGTGLQDEIIEILQALEAVIVRKVIETATDEDMENLQRLISRINVFIQNNMLEDGVDEVGRLFTTLYQISKYERVVSIIETYDDYISLIRNNAESAAAPHPVFLDNLNKLVDAIVKKDLDEALFQVQRRYKAF